MSDRERYPKQIAWSQDDEGFIALAPDLPGCSAFGETEADALAELDHAIVAWIEAAKAAGNSVPSPSLLPAPLDYSGKVLLRMARSLHARLAQAAKSEGVSLNHHINMILTEGSSRRQDVNLIRQSVITEIQPKSALGGSLAPSFVVGPATAFEDAFVNMAAHKTMKAALSVAQIFVENGTLKIIGSAQTTEPTVGKMWRPGDDKFPLIDRE